MELGSWSVAAAGPTLLGLIPLVLFIVISLTWQKQPVIMALIPAIVGALLCGWGPSEFGQLLMNSAASLLGHIGLLLMLGAGLGAVMQKTGVTHALSQWIVKYLKVNSRFKALIMIGVVMFILAFASASVLAAAPVAAPILLPMAAEFGLAPVTVAFAIFLFGSAGCHISPVLSDNILRTEFTGLSMREVISWSSLPYAILTVVITIFVSLWLDKYVKNRGAKLYSKDMMMQEGAEVKPEQKRAAIAFLIAFAGCIAYILAANPGFKFIFFYMIFLTAVCGFFGRNGLVQTANDFVEGGAKSFNLYLCVVVGQAMMTTIEALGGFAKLGEVLGGFIGTDGSGSKLALYIIAMLFGVFGVNGMGTTQALIIQGTFEPLYTALGAQPGLWTMVLCLGTMISVIMYPSAAHICYLGVAQTDDMKSLMKACWITAAIQLVFGIAYMVIGNAVLG